MIGSSKRQRESEPQEGFVLHRRLAAADAWHRRLTVASAAALAGSAAAWLAGMPLTWHTALIALGFVIGMAWPVPDPTDRVLGWLAERTGLAYETALSLQKNDPWGLREAVLDRAHASSVRVRSPDRQHWWIAILAVALGLLLLPAAQLLGPSGATNGGGAPPEATSPLFPEPEPEEPRVEPEDVDDVERAADPRDSDGAPAETAAEDPAPGAAGDQETLSRFLDNLRERDPFQPVDPSGEETGAAPLSEQREEEAGENRGGAGRENESGPGEPQEDQQPGEAAEGSGESTEGEREGDQGRPEEGAEEGDEEGVPGPTAGESEDAPPEGETPAGGEEPGNGDGELEPDASSGVGQGPSAPRPTEGAEGDPSREPEFLPGELGQGPENPGGSVLLPGEDEVEVPSELRRGEYRRAVEEAVTDGQVPLEYQEIIRNYFR